MSSWHYAICGLPRFRNAVNLMDGLRLAPLTREFARMSLPGMGGLISRAHLITADLRDVCAELIVSGVSRNLADDGAYSVLASLQLAGFHAVTSPLFANVPLRELAKAPNQGFTTGPWRIEGAQARRKPFEDGPVLRAPDRIDFGKTRKLLFGFLDVAPGKSAFQGAVEAFDQHRFIRLDRLAMASLWVGIEAFFSESSPPFGAVSAWVALAATKFLGLVGTARKDEFKEVKKLYSVRSSIMHGRRVPPRELSFAIVGSYDLLRRLLLRAIALGDVPRDGTWDGVVFDD